MQELEELFASKSENLEIKIQDTKRQDFLHKYQLDNSVFDPIKKPGVAIDRYILRDKADENVYCPHELIFKAITIEKEDYSIQAIENEIKANAFLESQKNKPNYFLKYYGWAVLESLSTFTYYIFLEICYEGSLQNLLNKNLNMETIFKYFIQITDGLLFLKSLGFAHRDLKLQNILINKGTIKLMDFGLIKKVDYNFNLEESNFNTIMVGTESYLSPEQLYYLYSSKKDEEIIDPYAGDIYSFGLIMINLFRGKPLYYQTQRRREIFESLNPEEQLYCPDQQLGDKYIMEQLKETIKERSKNQENSVLLNLFQKIIVQMLIYNPKRRIELIDLKILLIKKLQLTKELRVEEKIMCLEKYGLYKFLQASNEKLKVSMMQVSQQIQSQNQEIKVFNNKKSSGEKDTLEFQKQTLIKNFEYDTAELTQQTVILSEAIKGQDSANTIIENDDEIQQQIES